MKTYLVVKSLTTEVAPMVYVMMFVNLMIGLFFFTGFFMSDASSILYSTGVLVDREIWGLLLTLSSASALYGMIYGNDRTLQLGGIAGWMLWIFAAIALAQGGYWYVFVTTAVFHMLFHGYVYLASAIGVLRRTTIRG